MNRIAIFVFIACASPPGYAWCEGIYPDLDGDGDLDAPIPFDRELLFEIEDDYTKWAAFFRRDGDVDDVELDNTPGSPLYYKDVVRNVIDAGLQYWVRVGRVPIRLGIVGLELTRFGGHPPNGVSHGHEED